MIRGHVALALLLAGCQTVGDQTANSTEYRCEDGSVIVVAYPDTERAIVTYNGQMIPMTVAVSASGARYVGGGWQWWSKGMTKGWLAPLAPQEKIASAPGVACTAR